MSRRVALLLGNTKYGSGLPPLENPGADIAALTRVLADPRIGGFDEVKPFLDATSSMARLEIARFFSGRSPDDLLLLYFSGHGLRSDRGGLYLAVQDTDAKLLSGTAVPAAFIAEEMDNCRSRRQILILDCCYSGAFERGAKGPEINPATVFHGNGLGRLVLTASDSTQLAWEDVAASSAGGLSVFTRHLVKGIESGEADSDGDGLIGVDELYDYVYARVVEENPRQTPGKSAAKQQGEIILARNPVGPRPRSLPPELTQALDSPLAAVREGGVRELARLLHGSDAGLRESVRRALEQASNDDSRRVATAAAEVLAALSPPKIEPPPLRAPASKTVPDPPPRTTQAASIPVPATLLAAATPKVTKMSLRFFVGLILAGIFALFVLAALIGVVGSLAKQRASSKGAETPADSASSDSTAAATDPDAGQELLREAKSWLVVLADPFDSPETSTSFGQSDLISSDGICDVKGSISSGVLRISLNPGPSGKGCFHWLASNAQPLTDFYLKVDLRPVPTQSGDAGLVLRLNQDDTPQHNMRYYAFLIDQEKFSFSFFDSGKWSDLAPWTETAVITPGQLNSVAVLAEGSEFILFINDRQVQKVSDSTLSSGWLGIGVDQRGGSPSTYEFDNFELREKPAVKTAEPGK